eukprot:GGOE01001555.1.p1 GENE.GGOE01001555.1~~GGOE01001555.1.p1  ORF type:complete len:994 (+),score=322.69 GGOE01001555.1:389-2983(+)
MGAVMTQFKAVAMVYASMLRSQMASKGSTTLTTMVSQRVAALQRFAMMNQLGLLNLSESPSDDIGEDDCVLLGLVCSTADEFGGLQTVTLGLASGRYYSCANSTGVISVISSNGSLFNEYQRKWLPSSSQKTMKQRCMADPYVMEPVARNCPLPLSCQCGVDPRCSIWYTPFINATSASLVVSDVFAGLNNAPAIAASFPLFGLVSGTPKLLGVVSSNIAFYIVDYYMSTMGASNGTYAVLLLNDTYLTVVGSIARKCGSNETNPGNASLPKWSGLRACDSGVQMVASWLFQNRTTSQATLQFNGVVWDIFPTTTSYISYYFAIGMTLSEINAAIDASDVKATAQLSAVRTQQIAKVAATGKTTRDYMTMVGQEEIEATQAMQDTFLLELAALENTSRAALAASQQSSTAQVEELTVSQTTEVDSLKAKHLDAMAITTGWTIAVVFAILIVVLLCSAWNTITVTNNLTNIIGLMEDVANMKVENLQVPQNSHVTEVARIQCAFQVLIVRLAEYKSYMPAGLFEQSEDSKEAKEERDNDEGSESEASDLESQHPSTAVKSLPLKQQPSFRSESSGATQSRGAPSSRGLCIPGGRRALRKNIVALSLNVLGFRDTLGSMNDTLIKSTFSQYVGLIHEAVAQNRGNIDCILGDQVFVTFNAHITCADPAGAAAAAAFEMQGMISQKVGDRFKFQIGLSFGAAFAGTVGYAKFKSMVTMGSPMKIASILSHLAHFGNSTILADSTLEDRLRFTFSLTPVELIHLPQLSASSLHVSPSTRVLMLQDKIFMQEDEWMYQLGKGSPITDWNQTFSHVTTAPTIDAARGALQQYLAVHPADAVALRLRDRLPYWVPGFGVTLCEGVEPQRPL